MTETSKTEALTRRTLLATVGFVLAASSVRLIRAAGAPGVNRDGAPVAGTVAGLLRDASHNGVNRFRGIPYAQSIAGRNRFLPPQPVEPWTAIRAAARYADSSPQQSLAVFSQ